MNRRILTEAGEQASARVMTTLAYGVDSAHLRSATSTRLGGTRAVLLSDPRHFMVLPHLTAIAEEFSHRMLIACSLATIDLGHPLLRDLWKRGENQAEGRWSDHVEAWKTWHGIMVASYPMYNVLRGFIEARNAIMHGLGSLTRLQLRQEGGRSVKALLMGAGLGVEGTRILVSVSAVRRGAEVSANFIEWLDFAIQDAGLDSV